MKHASKARYLLLLAKHQDKYHAACKHMVAKAPEGVVEGSSAMLPGVVTEEALLVMCECASDHASEEDADCRLEPS